MALQNHDEIILTTQLLTLYTKVRELYQSLDRTIGIAGIFDISYDFILSVSACPLHTLEAVD